MRRELATVLLALIIVLLAPLSAQNRIGGTQVDNDIAKTIVAQEQALYQALAKRDKGSFQSLVLAEGVWTTTSGFVPIRLLSDELGVFQLAKFRIENPNVSRLDDNSALVVYIRTAEGKFQEQPLAQTALASTVWIRREGAWRAIHHQETGLNK
jgi:hypothetical protein